MTRGSALTPIVLAVLTIALFVVSRRVASQYGTDVGARFLERNPRYDAPSLSQWTAAHPREAAAYVWPVLYPIDLLFTLSLGAFLWTASARLAASGRLQRYVALLLVLPAIYLVTDLIEDALLARFLLRPRTITPAMVSATLTITMAKIWSVGLALLQVALLVVALFL